MPEVFTHLDRQETGAGGEIQLTDAMEKLLGRSPFHGLRFEGRRYDCGSRLGYLEAIVASETWDAMNEEETTAPLALPEGSNEEEVARRARPLLGDQGRLLLYDLRPDIGDIAAQYGAEVVNDPRYSQETFVRALPVAADLKEQLVARNLVGDVNRSEYRPSLKNCL